MTSKVELTEKSHRFLLLSAIALVLSSILIYLRALDKPHVFEFIRFIKYPIEFGDYNSFWEWWIKDFALLKKLLRHVPFLIQGAVVSWGWDTPIVMHAINLSLLTGCSFLIFRFLLREGVNRYVALSSGMLILVHPANAITVTDVINIDVPLACLFFMLSLSLYQKSRIRVKKAADYLLESLFIVLMLFSYEQLVVAPLLLFAYELLKSNNNIRKVFNRNFITSFILWSAIIVFYVSLRLIVFQGIGGYTIEEDNPLFYVPIIRVFKFLSGIFYLNAAGLSGGLLILALIPFIIVFIFHFKKLLRYIPFLIIWILSSIAPFLLYTIIGDLGAVLATFGLAIFWGKYGQDILDDAKPLIVRIITVFSVFLILSVWLVENQISINIRTSEVLEEESDTELVYNSIANPEIPQTIVYASDRMNRHISLRIADKAKNKNLRFLILEIGERGYQTVEDLAGEMNEIDTDILYISSLGRNFKVYDVYDDFAETLKGYRFQMYMIEHPFWRD